MLFWREPELPEKNAIITQTTTARHGLAATVYIRYTHHYTLREIWLLVVVAKNKLEHIIIEPKNVFIYILTTK